MKLNSKQQKLFSSLTPFQQSVLRACARIPKGQARTYSELAKSIGNPRAARAVGSALAKNPLAPLIPCHRVIRADGKIGGYSAKGGMLAKRKLLLKERTNI
jgi:O-6-methylguanine DNA methyltransferase